MGVHRDEDERDLSAPVVSISLGDTARFRLGGLRRRDPSRVFDLKSGDVVILGGQARLAYHGVDRIISGSSGLLVEGGRFNLTLRRVAPSMKRLEA
jgi:alkylated DNA repair protein (DNA oxidative demethylase)